MDKLDMHYASPELQAEINKSFMENAVDTGYNIETNRRVVYCVLVDTITRVSNDICWDEDGNYDDYYETVVTATRLDSIYANYDRAMARKDEIDDELNVEEYAYVREYEVR